MDDIRLSETIKIEFAFPQDEFLQALNQEYSKEFHGLDGMIEERNGRYFLMKDDDITGRRTVWKEVREVSKETYEYYNSLKAMIRYRSDELSKAQQRWRIIFDKIHDIDIKKLKD